VHLYSGAETAYPDKNPNHTLQSTCSETYMNPKYLVASVPKASWRDVRTINVAAKTIGCCMTAFS
jgi:hypothetical protein